MRRSSVAWLTLPVYPVALRAGEKGRQPNAAAAARVGVVSERVIDRFDWAYWRW